MGQSNPLSLLPLEQLMQQAYREPADDFVCLRYRVWYSSLDCAVRTHFKTAPGCLGCSQGRFNLRRHGDAVTRMRFPLLHVHR